MDRLIEREDQAGRRHGLATLELWIPDSQANRDQRAGALMAPIELGANVQLAVDDLVPLAVVGREIQVPTVYRISVLIGGLLLLAQSTGSRLRWAAVVGGASSTACGRRS